MNPLNLENRKTLKNKKINLGVKNHKSNKYNQRLIKHSKLIVKKQVKEFLSFPFQIKLKFWTLQNKWHNSLLVQPINKCLLAVPNWLWKKQLHRGQIKNKAILKVWFLKRSLTWLWNGSRPDSNCRDSTSKSQRKQNVWP